MLDMALKDIERVLYFEHYIVTEPGLTPLKQHSLLSEDEYNSGWQQDHDDEVVLVLPDEGRKTAAAGNNPTTGQPYTLLETAKLLMAVTPNGI